MVDTDLITRTFDLLSVDGGPIHWTAKNPRGRAAVGGHSRDTTALIRHANQQDGWDFYVSLNPSSRSCIKPSKDDITHLSCVGIDIDPHKDAKEIDIEPAARALDSALTSFTSTPNSHIILSSGRGIWAWVFIEPRPLLTTEDRESADSLIKGFTASFIQTHSHLSNHGNIDSSCAELSRIARCPGTINHKSGNQAHICIDYYPIKPLPYEEFSKLGSALAPAYGLPEPPSPITGRSIHEIVPHCNVTSRQFILLGVDSATESRHRRLFSAAKNLLELGIEPDIAEYMLWSGAERCLPNLNVSDPGVVRRMVRQVWRSA
jgi:hypothetical protein